MNWSYKFSSECPASVYVDIQRDGHHLHGFWTHRLEAGDYTSTLEPMKRMFRRAHKQAEQYIQDDREAVRLAREGNKRGKEFATRN